MDWLQAGGQLVGTVDEKAAEIVEQLLVEGGGRAGEGGDTEAVQIAAQ
jgi:hypothetical protein